MLVMGREALDYWDWFGKGNTLDDIDKAKELHGNPERILVGGHMAALIYADKVVVVGYDGNEYQHEFIMDRVIE